MFTLFVLLLLCADPMEAPENIQAFKVRCEAEKAAELLRIDKQLAEEKLRMKNTSNPKDKQTLLARVKKTLAKEKEVKASEWYTHSPRIDLETVGSIGEFYEPMPNNQRLAIEFRPDKIEADKMVGAIIHHGATPKLLVRAGGNIARNIYSEPGAGSETKVTILGDPSG